MLTDATANPQFWGSTLWTSPASDWVGGNGVVVVPAVDTQPYTTTVSADNVITATSGSVSYNNKHFSITKVFHADLARQAIVIDYKLNNLGTTSFSLAHWEVTRVFPDGLVFFPSGTKTNVQGSPDQPLKFVTSAGYTWYDNTTHVMGMGDSHAGSDSLSPSGDFIAEVAPQPGRPPLHQGLHWHHPGAGTTRTLPHRGLLQQRAHVYRARGPQRVLSDRAWGDVHADGYVVPAPLTRRDRSQRGQRCADRRGAERARHQLRTRRSFLLRWSRRRTRGHNMRHAFYALVVAMFALSALATPSGCSNNGPPGSVSGAGGNGVDASNVTADANGAGGRVAAIGDAAVDGVAGGKGLEAGTDGSADVAIATARPSTTARRRPDQEGDRSTRRTLALIQGGGASAAMIKAGCGMYAAGTKAMTAVDFCTLFQATCDDYTTTNR